MVAGFAFWKLLNNINNSCRILKKPILQTIYSSNKNLILWARSEILGYAEGGSRLNPKHEIRTKYPSG